MGYTTNFEGNVKTDKPVSKEIYDLINGLAKTRRMKRNITGFGVEGEFYYDPKSFAVCGQSWDDNTIEDSNKPPRTQPSLWLQWVVQPDRHTIEWDGSEKF